MERQYFPYLCPHCKTERNALEVALGLEPAVLRVASARLNARSQTPHAGPGRPTLARCPGCDLKMTVVELREHRMPCIRQRLQELRGHKIRLAPKDPDPYPNFSIENILESEVVFKKLSSSQRLTIELQKIAEITVIEAQELVSMRLLGFVRWHDDRKEWLFAASRVGRPSRSNSASQVMAT
jgi:hypothetical protein